MKTEPFDPRWTAVAASWLNNEQNWKWIQAGSRAPRLDPVTFRIMTQRPSHSFHLFFDDERSEPIGLVALSDLDVVSRSASVWCVLGEKECAGRGYSSRAVNDCLAYGFNELGLESISAWTLPLNIASLHILRQNGFRYIGRQRRCHPLDGKLYDRLLYDLLAEEFHPNPKKVPIRFMRTRDRSGAES